MGTPNVSTSKVMRLVNPGMQSLWRCIGFERILSRSSALDGEPGGTPAVHDIFFVYIYLLGQIADIFELKVRANYSCDASTLYLSLRSYHLVLIGSKVWETRSQESTVRRKMKHLDWYMTMKKTSDKRNAKYYAA